MTRTETCPDGYVLPEGVMCLTSQGWAYGTLEEVNIRTFQPLKGVLEAILAQSASLLGPGTLVCLTRRASPPDLFCYLVFEPGES